MSLRKTDLLAASLLLAVACVETSGGGDAGSTIDYGLCPAPVMTDADAGVDPDAGADPDAGTAGVDPVPEGVACDPETGLFWQLIPSPLELTQAEAADHCDGLNLGEIQAWRLPTITELRGLVRDCVATESGGDCKVSDPDCLTPAICMDPSCDGCAAGEGPGASGCYLDPGLGGACSPYWSSSLQDGFASATFFWLDYTDARVDRVSDVRGALARCVHAPPLP